MTNEKTWARVEDLRLWDRNYNEGDVGAIRTSIREFGFNNAVRVWNGVVMAGNHSVKALRQLLEEGEWEAAGGSIRPAGDGWEIQVVDVSHLTEMQAEAFAIADNRTAALASSDDEKLLGLLDSIRRDETVRLEATGYDADDMDAIRKDLENSGILSGLYSRKIEAPTYTPSDRKPEVGDLFDAGYYTKLITEISRSDGLTEEERAFLSLAATRHIVFDFTKIADYYAHSDNEVKRLMEESALVIIDYNRAIELGFVKLVGEISAMEAGEHG